jgi:hypothetical protein
MTKNEMTKKIVPDAIVDEAWREVAAATDETVLATLNETFAQEQPAVADMLGEASSNFAPDATDLAYFIALVLWKACARAAAPAALREISESALTEAFHEAERWYSELGGANGHDGAILAEKKLKDPKSYAEPYLMGFVIDAVMECIEDGLELTPEEQFSVLVLSKALVDAFRR